jgi:hypothetical protein
MFVSVLVRRLRPGKTYEDFVEAWYPDKGFGLTGRGPFVARSLEDESEILTLALIDLPDRGRMDEALKGVAEQEAVRHERLVEVVESTSVRGLYEVADEFDFSTDETVERGRPA